MNLIEALGGALPEIPARRKRGYVKLHPKILWHEQVMEGQPIIMAYVPGVENLFTFTPEQWQMVQQFDGKRSYHEIAEALTVQLGAPVSEEDVQELVASLDAQDFWYQSEQNRTLAGKLHEQRHKQAKKESKLGDLSTIILTSYDPDRYFTWLEQRTRWIFTPGFALFSLVALVFTLTMFITHWGEIGRDTLRYYTFTEKTFKDLIEFWILFFLLAGFHESAHGLSCKHYGGGVHKMGILLMYLNIGAFYVDVTESWLYTDRRQRISVLFAGVWIEMLICAAATAIWWATVPGNVIHEFTYKVMLITGVAVLLINFNPLVKADGYYIFAELIGITGLKEDSTQYVSAWVQNRIFRLPVEVPYVAHRRRWLFVPYALLSGTYSYGLLLAVSRLAYNIFRSFTPEWAFVPGLIVVLLIFKSRIRKLVTFMQTVYLDKKEWLAQWLTPKRLVPLGLSAVVVFFVPVWRETVSGRFLLEPARREVVRAEVPGRVTDVIADEGDKVVAGTPLVRLRNPELESAAAQARAELEVATARATQAQLHYGDFGPAEQERRQRWQQSRLLEDQKTRLELRSPISGVVFTPKVRDRLGSYVEAGTEIAEVADTSTLRAFVYLSEYGVRDIGAGARASLRPDGSLASWRGTVTAISPASSEMAPGLMEKVAYKGLRPPVFYRLTVLLPNLDGALYSGMAGDAKVFVRRRSLAGFVWQGVRDFFARKVW